MTCNFHPEISDWSQRRRMEGSTRYFPTDDSLGTIQAEPSRRMRKRSAIAWPLSSLGSAAVLGLLSLDMELMPPCLGSAPVLN